VTTSLQSWWGDFHHFYLAILRNLGQFIAESDPGKPGHALYGMEMSQFFILQATFHQKVVSILRNIWFRGAILIIKKFKFLRSAEQLQ